MLPKCPCRAQGPRCCQALLGPLCGHKNWEDVEKLGTPVKLIVTGNMTIDDIVLPDGRTRMGLPGGNALYASMAASLWSDGVAILTRKTPGYPPQNIQKIAGMGICTDGMAPFDRQTMRIWQIYESDGRRTSIQRNLVVGGMESYSPLPADIPQSYRRPSVQAVLLCAMRAENQYQLAADFAGRGVPVLLDPPEVEQEHERQRLLIALQYVDVFLPSLQEVEEILGHGQLHRAARQFARYGPRYVVIKLGQEGCLVYRRQDDSFVSLPCYNTRTVDATGAGDSFGGGFLAGYAATGGDVLAAACQATVTASFAVEDYSYGGLLRTGSPQATQRLQVYRQQNIGRQFGREEDSE